MDDTREQLVRLTEQVRSLDAAVRERNEAMNARMDRVEKFLMGSLVMVAAAVLTSVMRVIGL